MKHLRIYRAIRLVQRHGSIRKAAEALAVSPSALNRSIQNFEGAIGVDVFERVPGGVRLTAAGELLLGVVDRHLVEFGELQRQLGTLRDGETGTLRLGIGADIAAGLPMDALGDLSAAHRGASVAVVSGEETRRLRAREIDLAVVTNPATDRAVEVLASHAVALRVWATGPAFPARVGLHDLVDRRLVLPPEDTGSRSVIDHAFRRHALRERTVTSLAAAHLTQPAPGPMACIFPRTVVADGAAPPGCAPLPLEPGRVQISVLRLAGVPLSRLAQSFLRHLEARLDAVAD